MNFGVKYCKLLQVMAKRDSRAVRTGYIRVPVGRFYEKSETVQNFVST